MQVASRKSAVAGSSRELQSDRSLPRRSALRVGGSARRRVTGRLEQMRRIVSTVSAAAIAAVILSLVGRAAGTPACDADNGGIKLPQGFCAAVVADNVGPARHLVVAPNGDVFVSLETGRGGTGGGVVALRDADGDGKLETKEPFGQGSATGIGLRNGYLYYATPTQIIRYKLAAGQIKPTGAAEIVATDLPERRQPAG